MVSGDNTILGPLLQALATEGYELEAAFDGSTGLALLQGWQPDLIVLDLSIPDLDAQTFLDELDEQRTIAGAAAIPVVVLAANHDRVAQAGELQAATILVKPFTLDDLLATIDRLMR